MTEFQIHRYWRDIEKKLRKETNIKQEHLRAIKMFIDLVDTNTYKNTQNQTIEKITNVLKSKGV